VIKEVVNTRLAPDEISEVLGDKVYALRYYFNELRDRVLGIHSTDLIGVSRYYLMKKPPVAVDFEPPPPNKMYLEEKRKFFMEKGIVYVPVYLNERLTVSQFRKRVDEEHENLVRGYREALQDQALLTKKDLADPLFSDPEVLAYIDRETLARCKAKKLRGVAMTKHIPHMKEQVIAELKVLGKDGTMARIGRSQQTPVTP